jgi:hypothetical protein
MAPDSLKHPRKGLSNPYRNHNAALATSSHTAEFSPGWCREGESIPTIFKGVVKISPIFTNCNIGAGLRVVLRRDSKSAWRQFPVIWGDFGRRFTRKSY